MAILKKGSGAGKTAAAPAATGKAKSKWGTRLAKSQSAWADSEESYKATFGADNLPEDTYVFKLQDCAITEFGKENKLCVSREHVVAEGEYKGTVVRDRFALDNEWGPVFCRRWLNIIGVEPPEDISSLETTIADVKATEYECKGRFTRKNGFPGVDVISLIGADDGTGDDGAAAGGEEGEGQEVDLDSMDLKALRALVKENELPIDGYLKMKEDDLRAAIAEALGGGGEEAAPEEEGAGDEVDLDAMDKAALLKLIKDNEIDIADLGFKNKLLFGKADEKALRKALEAYMAANDEGGEAGGSEDDELLEAARIFCGTWGIKVAEDADLDTIKKALEKCEFPAKEVDDDEKELLTKLELESLIVAPAPAAKKKVVLKK